ncbi:MAG: response regulator, partial [Chloroflexota bacterium]|nr:response regulator [Chloroflexota bacterium]
MGQSSTHPWTVLVVDDSESIRVALRLYLEADGYAVEEASDGLRAFVRLSHRDTRYLVLLDHAMPELDGWELSFGAQASRAKAEGRELSFANIQIAAVKRIPGQP